MPACTGNVGPGKDAGLVNQTARSAAPRRAGASPGPLASSGLSGPFPLHFSLFQSYCFFPPCRRVSGPPLGLCFTLCHALALLLGPLSPWASSLISHSTNTHASLDPGAAHWLVGENIWLGDSRPPQFSIYPTSHFTPSRLPMTSSSICLCIPASV